MTVSAPVFAQPIEGLRPELVGWCCVFARCESLFRRLGWVHEADLMLDLFEAFEDRMSQSYPSAEVSFSSGS